jgi:hypothetical protein
MKADWEQPALNGLPEYGVLLTGTPENPIIENRSGKGVIGYKLMKAGQNGHGPSPLTLLAFPGQPAGIPNGGAVYANSNVPVNLASQRPGVLASPILSPLPGRGPIVSATLQNAVFGDGGFVGVEEEWVFEQFGRVMKAIVEVGLLAKAARDQLEALAISTGAPLGPPPRGEDPRTYFERRLAATRLVQERKWKGDAGAMQLAEIYASLPTLWK